MAEEFIAHHRLQIKRSSKCVERACHVALRELCAMQITNQTMDIVDFQTVIERYEDDRAEGTREVRGPALAVERGADPPSVAEQCSTARAATQGPAPPPSGRRSRSRIRASATATGPHDRRDA